MSTAPTFSNLQNLSDDDLKKAYDRAAGLTQVGTQFYLDELNRRSQARETRAILRYTCWVTAMTAVITVATLVQLAIAIF